MFKQVRSSTMTAKVLAQRCKAFASDEVHLPESDVPFSQVEARAVPALVLLALRSLECRAAHGRRKWPRRHWHLADEAFPVKAFGSRGKHCARGEHAGVG